MVAQLKVAGGGVSGGGALLTPCPSRLRQAWEEVEVAKKGDSKRIGGWEEGGGTEKGEHHSNGHVHRLHPSTKASPG